MIDKLIQNFKKDDCFCKSWEANIAMAFIDNTHWYKQKTNKKLLDDEDIKIIANHSAKYFINNLIK